MPLAIFERRVPVAEFQVASSTTGAMNTACSFVRQAIASSAPATIGAAAHAAIREPTAGNAASGSR